MIKYITEFIGTFLFLSVILNATRPNSSIGSFAPIAIGLALMTSILFGGNISGGHFNPAVSVMFAFKKELATSELVPYIGAQLLGAFAAKYYYDFSLLKK
jgi:glycerol uptake facilitator-like aquaporin